MAGTFFGGLHGGTQPITCSNLHHGFQVLTSLDYCSPKSCLWGLDSYCIWGVSCSITESWRCVFVHLHTILIFREAFVWAVGFTMGFSKVMYPHVSFKQLMDDVGYAQSGDAIIPVSFCILLSSII